MKKNTNKKIKAWVFKQRSVGVRPETVSDLKHEVEWWAGIMFGWPKLCDGKIVQVEIREVK